MKERHQLIRSDSGLYLPSTRSVEVGREESRVSREGA